MIVQVFGVKIELLAEKAIKIGANLLLADLHLGKVRHFRKSGIALPASAALNNYERLIQLLEQTSPERVIFMGDLFHSYYNEEWNEFSQVLNHFQGIEFILVEGNHDVLSDYRYESSRLDRVPELNLGPFLLTHIPLPLNEVPEGVYNLAGHIHPGIELNGAGRQKMRLPCFHFGEKQGILPAFGSFTGTGKVKKMKTDRVFVPLNNTIIEK